MRYSFIGIIILQIARYYFMNKMIQLHTQGKIDDKQLKEYMTLVSFIDAVTIPLFIFVIFATYFF